MYLMSWVYVFSLAWPDYYFLAGMLSFLESDNAPEKKYEVWPCETNTYSLIFKRNQLVLSSSIVLVLLMDYETEL